MNLHLATHPDLPVQLNYALRLLAAVEIYGHHKDKYGTRFLEDDLQQTRGHFEFSHSGVVTEADKSAIFELLHFSWNMEYSLRKATMLLADEEPLKVAREVIRTMQHGLRQSLRAFLYCFGIRANDNPLLEKEIGRLIVKNYYPSCWNYYAADNYSSINTYRLPHKNLWEGSVTLDEVAAERDLHNGLKAGRQQKFKDIALLVQQSSTPLRYDNQQVVPLLEFSDHDWDQLTWRTGYTTVWDVLAQAKGAILDVDDQEDVYFDVEPFIATCVSITNRLSAIHESYIARYLGPATWTELLDYTPEHIREFLNPAARFASEPQQQAS